MTPSSGVPTSNAYAACVASPIFGGLKTYSDAFLKRNRRHLLWYSIRWSEDPLNHPTRRWEYPYTRARLEGARGQRILDAGSGITFFPYYLMEANPGVRVTCCDRDAYVGDVYAKINRNQASKVEFQRCDLAALPFPDGTFDAIYCISVLEHTGHRDSIVQEFSRVLKPGGRLVVTFDISLDGTKDIPVDSAKALLALLSSKLHPLDSAPIDVGRGDIYATDQGAGMPEELSLWKLYRWTVRAAKTLISTRSLRSSPMTVYCGEFSRPEQVE